MERAAAVNFVGELENRSWGVEDEASRCGLSLGGDGRPIRDAALWTNAPASLAAGARIAVSWSQDVAWRKPIRVLKC